MTRQILAALVCAIIVGSVSDARANTLAGGAQHTVIVTPSGAAWTWGANTNGQLGDGTTTAHKVRRL